MHLYEQWAILVRTHTRARCVLWIRARCLLEKAMWVTIENCQVILLRRDCMLAKWLCKLEIVPTFHSWSWEREWCFYYRAGMENENGKRRHSREYIMGDHWGDLSHDHVPWTRIENQTRKSDKFWSKSQLFIFRIHQTFFSRPCGCETTYSPDPGVYVSTICQRKILLTLVAFCCLKSTPRVTHTHVSQRAGCRRHGEPREWVKPAPDNNTHRKRLARLLLALEFFSRCLCALSSIHPSSTW